MQAKKLITRRPTKQAVTYSNPDWLSPFFTTAANIDVTPKNAMTCVTVKACVGKIAKTIASLSLMVYSELPQGGKIKVRKHPVSNCFNVSPDGIIDAFLWREYVVEQLCLYGNSFAEIEPFGNGTYCIHPLPADTVEVKRLQDGVFYKIRGDTSGKLCPQNRILHFALSGDGLVGSSPVRQCKDAIGLLMAMDKFSSKFYQNGMTTSGILEHPAELSPQARDNLRASMTSSYTGDNAHKLMILDEGMKYTPNSVNPEQAQMVNARRMAIQEICRIWDMDPAMIGEHSESHYNNVEQQITNYAVHCIRPMAIRIESEINRKLFNNQEEFFVLHDMNSLLRADPLVRAQIAQITIPLGAKTVNEYRAEEGYNPIDESTNDIDEDVPPAIGDEPPKGTAPIANEDTPDQVSSSETKQAASETKQAAVDLFVHEISRLLRRETEFASKAALKPEQFLEAIENFTVKQQEIAEQNLKPAMILLKTLGIEAGEIPNLIVNSAKNELFDVAGAVTKEGLPLAIETWSEKRKEILQDIKKRLSL